MADETKVASAGAGCTGSAGEGRGLKALVVGSSVVLWVVALFAVTSLNSLRAEMKELRQTVDSVLLTTQAQSLEAMQAVGKDGEVAYTFQRAPQLAVTSPCGMGAGSCGMGACGGESVGTCGGSTGAGSAAGPYGGGSGPTASCGAHGAAAAPAAAGH